MTALLVDANNVMMRGLHVFARPGQHRLAVGDVQTGPLLVFINTISRFIREEEPDRVLIAWDGGRSTFRTALDPEYKGQRGAAPDFEEAKTSSFNLAKEFLSLAGLHHVEVRGFEADDLIAWHWHQHRPLDDRLVIVSSDKDFLSLLVPGQVEQVRLGSADTPTDRWTHERVMEEMKCPPVALVDAMALAGDASDNIPGIPRFGMKTAIKTLAKHEWSLAAVVEQDERVRPHAARVALNRALVDLRSLPSGLHLEALPPFRPTVPGDLAFDPLVAFLGRYRLASVQTRLYDGTLWRTSTP